MRRYAATLLLLVVGSAAYAQPAVPRAGTTPVTAPLTVPFAYMETLAADVLEMDAEGVSVLGENACRQVELSDLAIVAAGDAQAPRLQASMAVLARAGIDAFGACRGPDPVRGRLRFFLEPGVAPGGSAAVFEVTGAEFRASDGSESLLTRPSRALAEKIVVPRLQAMEVDVAGPLGEIDALIERFVGRLPGGVDPLAERGSLAAVRVTPQGLGADIAFALAGVTPGDADVEEEPVAALDEAELAQWQRIEDEFDGFVTVLVADLASRTDKRELQLELAGLLIDARLRINAMLLGSGADEGKGGREDENASSDPLRELFIASWSTLAAVAAEIAADERGEAGQSLQMASFVAAGDALQIVDRVGPLYDIEISRDGLRRLARVLLEEGAPASFTPLPLVTDPALQKLFGIDPAEPAVADASPWPFWLEGLSPIARAHAQDPDPAMLLREIFPQRDNLDSYLAVVARLIAETLDGHWEDSRLTLAQRRLFDPLVRATAWKETCWRHYLRKDGEVAVIRSGVGAVGMMQIVGRVWRSLFDLERLERDVDYNLAAGIDILEHYFVDYAVRKGEHEQPGGLDNLVRATYSAYNAGPSKLSRYRQESAAPRARAVDAQFYSEYLRMVEQPWPSQSRCYAP